MRDRRSKSDYRENIAPALYSVADTSEQSVASETDNFGNIPDLRPTYDLQGDPRSCRWFGGIIVNFAVSEAEPDLHPGMISQINRSLAGRHPRYIYDQGTMYLTFRLLSFSERQIVEEFADELERWLGQTVIHRVFEHGPDEETETKPSFRGRVITIPLRGEQRDVE